MEQLTKRKVKNTAKELKRAHDTVLVLQDIQYARNVASSFRIADAAGVKKVFLTGISKQPPFGKELQQVSRHKERTVQWEHQAQIGPLLGKLKREGYTLIAIEFTDSSLPIEKLPIYLQNRPKVCFIAGSEVYGVNKKVLAVCDASVHIPMYGRGASLNVTHAVAVVLFSIS